METLSEQISQIAGQLNREPEVDEVDSDEQLLDGEGEIQEVAEDEGSDEREIRTLADLAEANDWDAEELYALEIAMPDSDEPIPIGKVKDEVTRMRREREELQRSLEQHATQLQQAQAMAAQSMQADQQMVQMAGQVGVLQEFLQSPELQAMKDKDPGAAALKVQEVQGMIGTITQRAQQYQQNLMQQSNMQRQQHLVGGEQYLRQQVPEWADPQVERAEKVQVARAFLEAGYSQADVSQMADPRAVLLVRELVQLRQQVHGGKQAAQQVRQSAKRSLKSGRLNRGSHKAAAVRKAKTTGKREDITAAARAILTGG